LTSSFIVSYWLDVVTNGKEDGHLFGRQHSRHGLGMNKSFARGERLTHKKAIGNWLILFLKSKWRGDKWWADGLTYIQITHHRAHLWLLYWLQSEMLAFSTVIFGHWLCVQGVLKKMSKNWIMVNFWAA